VGRSLLIRDWESVLWFKFDFGLLWCSFGGPEVVWWWKQLSLGVADDMFHLEGSYLGLSNDNGWLWISFFRGCFEKESVLGGDFIGVGVFCVECIFGCSAYIRRPSLYSLNHRSLLVLSRDLVFK